MNKSDEKVEKLPGEQLHLTLLDKYHMILKKWEHSGIWHTFYGKIC